MSAETSIPSVENKHTPSPSWKFANLSISIPTLLCIAILLAVGVRVLSALFQGDSIDTLPGIYDQVSYNGLAQRLIEGHGFSFGEDHWPATRAGEPTAHWSFLYTLYVAGIYALFGVHPLIVRLLQAVVVGVLHTWFAYRLGRRLFDPTVGVVAAALSAVYIYFVYYTGALMTESFYIVGVLWSLDVTLRLAARAQPAARAARAVSIWWLWVELGLAFGITTLLRQAFGLAAIFVMLWLWWRLLFPSVQDPTYAEPGETTARPWTNVIVGTMLAGCVGALLIVPWTIRNYHAFDQLVPLNTNSGYVLFWGNHPIYGTDFVGILPADGPTYYELIPPELLHLNEAELDSALLQRGAQFILDDPVRYLLLSMSRTREYFKFWPSAESSTVSNIARVGSFGIYLPFMVYGLFIWLVHYRRTATSEQRAGVLLLLLFAAVYTMMHLLTWSLIRYRVPVDAILVLFAALGLVDLIRRVTPALNMGTAATDGL